jgi:D-ribose pyranose/furanose isomerase RbsD
MAAARFLRWRPSAPVVTMRHMIEVSNEVVLDWHVEVLQIANELKAMSPEARRALLETVANFVGEDVENLTA